MSYGKVKDTFWTDDKSSRYSDDAKLLALYLLTGPHRNLIGCMRLPDGYIMEDVGWDKRRIGKAFAELQANGFLIREASGWTHIINQLRHDPLASPNHVKAAIKLAEQVPPSEVRQSLVKKLVEAIEALPGDHEKELTALNKLLASGFEGASKVLRTPEPIPAPVPEPAPEQAPCAPDGALDPYEAAVSAWNDLASELGLPRVERLTGKRRTALGQRLSECGGIVGWSAALGKVRDSPFLRGENDRGWTADFDFLVTQSKFTKLMEGGYDERSNGKIKHGDSAETARRRAGLYAGYLDLMDSGARDNGSEMADRAGAFGCEPDASAGRAEGPSGDAGPDAEPVADAGELGAGRTVLHRGVG